MINPPLVILTEITIDKINDGYSQLRNWGDALAKLFGVIDQYPLITVIVCLLFIAFIFWARRKS